MVPVGIEAMNVYTGTAFLDINKLAEYRRLDTSRLQSLLMKQKSVALPYEDPVTFGVNAARPIIDALSSDEKDRIELLITCTESSFDFSKSMSTYIHQYLGLNKSCRLMELKSDSYSGTAGLQMAISFILSQTSPGAKALVIATDITRFIVDQDYKIEPDSFAEQIQGAGAVAMLVGDTPQVFQVDFGANGYHSYEVMDMARPLPDSEIGDSDLSLLSYLDCCENAFKDYQSKVEGVDYTQTFSYLAFHTPFGGMVKGAHRAMMRKLVKAHPEEIEKDFDQRVIPGLIYCQRVGSIMGATTLLSLASTIDAGNFDTPKRVGVFAYGSGCSSEFFSGVVTKEGQDLIQGLKIAEQLDKRYELSIEEYEELLIKSKDVKFGTRNRVLDTSFIPQARSAQGKETLFLKQIREFHREYEWVS